MRFFYLAYRDRSGSATVGGPRKSNSTSKRIRPTALAKSSGEELSPELPRFDLPWGHYTRLLSVNRRDARDFYVGRQRRCRIGEEWYRIDLLLFHRRLRCLVIIDLKPNGFTPGDVG